MAFGAFFRPEEGQILPSSSAAWFSTAGFDSGAAFDLAALGLAALGLAAFFDLSAVSSWISATTQQVKVDDRPIP
jgi:hypothetical protein